MKESRSRFLITTALEESWVDGQSLLFLGEWCQLYSRKDQWAFSDHELVPYHWRNRGKLYTDFRYLDGLFEKLLPFLVKQLNDLHTANHSERYWRVLIGPWLLRFTHVLFDRWESIRSAVEQYEIEGTIVLQRVDIDLAPNDMVKFIEMIQGDDWNHYIYSKIIDYLGTIPIIYKAGDPIGITYEATQKKITIKKAALKAVARLTNICQKNAKIFFRDTYLSRLSSVLLQGSFWQFPQIKNVVDIAIEAVSKEQRSWGIGVTPANDFEKFLFKLIPTQVPRVYIEGYGGLNQAVGTMPWPKKPKLIFTSNALWYDDLTKAYVATKLDEGSALAYGQHGGGYGIAKFNCDEEHEVKISDYYLSMGWNRSDSNKIIPIGYLRFTKKISGTFKNKKNLLLVTLNTSRYPFRACSESALDLTKNIENSLLFVSKLKPVTRQQVIVRLTPSEKGWFHSDRWRDNQPEIKIDNGQKSIYRLMSSAKLVVSTYNQTTLLETLALGIPSIIYFDINETPLRQAAAPFYAALKQVGIFHETPESAAAHVNQVWADVDAWWFDTEVQRVVGEFTYNYCRRTPDVVKEVRKVFKDILHTAR